MDLLALDNKEMIEKTTLQRKLTLGGVTKAYPVYRIRLDLLYYNDQNDRIATWITQYKNDPSAKSFEELSEEEYNLVIQQFIVNSNPAAIEKTKNNIALVNQREPGVVLKDGRIIDGNRRFTCLRLLHNEDPSINYFEAVVLDDSDKNSQKQIKMLELSIQHGEEQRVDYNLIDMAVGAYHDIIETKLLTKEEYASSTNEPMSVVTRRLETAMLIMEFLEFMGVPKQYHIAREMQVYSVFFELVPMMKRCGTKEEAEALKQSVFSNTMMKTFIDQKKYLRSVKAMMDSGLFSSYIKRQQRICDELQEKKKEAGITNEKELKAFIKDNEEIKEDLEISLDRSLNQSKKAQTKSRPSQLVSKSISSLMDIDTRIIDKLSESEKEKLGEQLKRLTETVAMISDEVVPESHEEKKKTVKDSRPTRLFTPVSYPNEPEVICEKTDIRISNLCFSLPFKAVSGNVQENGAEYIAYFADDNYEMLSPVKQFTVKMNETAKVQFTLNDSASSMDHCLLIIRAAKDGVDEARSITYCSIKISFQVGFEF